MAFVLAGRPQSQEDSFHLPPSRSSSIDDVKDKPRIEIVLDQPIIYLKGTGIDVEPALLSGKVAVYLPESCSIKEITLQFRGKAHCSTCDGTNGSASSTSYVLCNHEWSFLEGDKSHSHTLKAGRHFFPFNLQLGGSLPSTISTDAWGGASVVYKLKAHAVRPGLSHNLQTSVPVIIVRSFSAGALEYQQTLEIENTWREKLMYSIILPHKAWAAGDSLTTIMKFSSLSKGLAVVGVTTEIQESTKIFGHSHEDTRVIVSVKHDIFGGKAVEVNTYPHATGNPGSALPASGNSSSSVLTEASSSNTAQNSELTTEAGNSGSTDESEDEAVPTLITINIPSDTPPSHGVDPIIVGHRIRWYISIINLDGHFSELRCSLPLFILDNRLLSEARSFTAQTRRLLLGGPDVPTQAEMDTELPSYSAHIRDRVANMYLPDSATIRVTNPWVHAGVSPVARIQRDFVRSWPPTPSGASTPLEAQRLSHLPHTPGLNDTQHLDWINSELLLSLSVNDPPALSLRSLTSPDSSDPPSRRSSRGSSPERAAHTSGHHETYVHSHASRNIQSLLKASMKPLTSISHPLRLSSRSHVPSNTPTSTPTPTPLVTRRPTIQFSDPNSGSALLHRAFTEVPDYQVASRGFLGGVPPLSSSIGLPPYTEVAGRGPASHPNTSSTVSL